MDVLETDYLIIGAGASGMAFAHLLATGTPHDTATAYRLDRFRTGHMIDERGAGAQPNLH